MKRLYTFYILLAAVILTVFLNSCGNTGLAAPGKPTALEPDPENPNKIELYWKAVEGADIYYVYRGTSETGTFTLEGQSVTSKEAELTNGDTELRYSFIDAFEEGDGGTYWYGVTAAANSDISSSGESDMSPVVKAHTYSGTWEDPEPLGAAAQLKLTADTSALWAVYSDDDSSDAISVKKYAEDENSTEDDPDKKWSEITTPMVTDGSVNNPFSVFLSGGELYTVFRDNSSADAVSMQYYHDSGTNDTPSFAWEPLGAEGFNEAAATAISAVTVGFGGTIYSAFLSDTDEGSLWKYDGTTEAWFSSNISSDLPVDLSTVRLVSHNNSLYFGYGDVAGTGLYLRAYDGSTALQAGGLVDAADIDDGNVVFVSGGGDLYAVYITDVDGTPNNGDGALIIKKYEDGSWSQISTSGDIDSNGSDYGVVDAIWFNGYLYVFYVDGAGDGWVKYYDEDEGWQSAEKNGEDITGTGSITSVQLASAGGSLYAGYIEDDIAYVRILE